MDNIKTFEEFHNLDEAKKEYVKVNFGDKDETISALDYITSHGSNYAVHPTFGITKKKNGDIWFEVATTKQKQNLNRLVSKNGGKILEGNVNEGNTVIVKDKSKGDFDVIRSASSVEIQRDKSKKGHFIFSMDAIDDLISALTKLKR